MDIEHMLAAREQELRALAAEKESLFKENRATWHLLDEREAEIHRLQVSGPSKNTGLSPYPPALHF